jgi:hypothetical protein
LINVGVTFSPPIRLPYNFNLSRCGGLLALNRAMDIEVLRTRLKNRTLDSILFPEDPILNANKIVSDSERVFPIEERRFVLGVIDVAKKSRAIDATLYDSKIVTCDLSSDMALRLKWGRKPVFAMSLGGWHPKCDPPPKFPKLRRLRLSLRSTSSFDLSWTVYHGITSNTLQLGAKLQLHPGACGAEVDGNISFGTLIYFSPFEFQTDISGGVGARYADSAGVGG